MKHVMLRLDRSIQFLMDSPVKPWNDGLRYLLAGVIMLCSCRQKVNLSSNQDFRRLMDLELIEQKGSEGLPII